MESKTKTFKIDVRVSLDEYTNIKKMSDELGMKMSGYMRATALNHAIIIKTDLDMIRQIRHIGNNINQIARQLNTYSDETIIFNSYNELKEFKQILQSMLNNLNNNDSEII